MLDQILRVDDDHITFMIYEKVIIKSSFSNKIVTSLNCGETLSYFDTIKHKNNKNKVTSQPQLIFFDLNMAVMGGWKFLNHFNSQGFAEFSTIKMAVLSFTIDPGDLEKSK